MISMCLQRDMTVLVGFFSRSLSESGSASSEAAHRFERVRPWLCKDVSPVVYTALVDMANPMKSKM